MDRRAGSRGFALLGRLLEPTVRPERGQQPRQLGP